MGSGSSSVRQTEPARAIITYFPSPKAFAGNGRSLWSQSLNWLLTASSDYYLLGLPVDLIYGHSPIIVVWSSIVGGD